MKVADIKLSWTKSPSAGVTKVVGVLNVDGTESTSEFGPEVESWMIEVKASQSVHFHVDTYDDEGFVVSSEDHAFQLGDLVAPLPATNLAHEIIGIRDVE